MARGPFSRSKDDKVDVILTPVEVELLGSVVSQLTQALDDPPDRLFPPAYRDDPEAQAEYARMMSEDLMAGKRRAVSSVMATLGRGKTKRDAWRVTLSADETQDWLAVLNDARLTLGSRLEVTEETYEREIDPSHPDAAAHEVFRYLGYLEEFLVETVMD